MSPETDGSFRDTLATIDRRGRRIWVYPSRPRGKLYTARRIVATFLLVFLFIAPFIKVGKHPLLLFDIVHRHFFIFGIEIWPHDFHLVVLSVIAFAVFVILFTAAFGRLFCGWICPQTVFLEMLFRRIEFLLEGNGPRQRSFNKAPMSINKFVRKLTKHVLFLGIAFLISNILISYFVGIDKLRELVSSSPTEHMIGFTLMMIFSLAIYGVYTRFREQVCTLVCPYGRLQSVLLDSNSIVVAYDHRRGEPRGKRVRGESRSDKGDCVDCSMCVLVCPTGIDIRHGTQLECVNCTACIDACNSVMKKVGLPPKLIRYTSHDQITKGKGFRITGRIAAYTVVLTLLIGLIGFLAASRSVVETTILRATGRTYDELEDGSIRNLYTIKVLNKSADSLDIELRLASPDGIIDVVGPPLHAEAEKNAESVFVVQIPRKELLTTTTPLVIEVSDGTKILEEVHTTFFGPEPDWNK